MVLTAYNQLIWRLLAGAAAIFTAIAVMGVSPTLAVETVEQKSFVSPLQAVAALVAAVDADNNPELLAILGPGAEDLVFSGDPVADQNSRVRFLKAYDEKNGLEQHDQGRIVLLIGSRDYPFPIPIVRQGQGWHFDTGAGRKEILNRRIGRNELHTIEVMHAFTATQREYACMDRNDGRQEFAQRFASSEGKKDGLYWEADEDEADSPFGPLIARATEEGYRGDLDGIPPEAFHGYYFKILKAQGEHANGGAFDYVADGKMILGFALVAYPAKYGASGIMTFIVNQEGVIYEKDLGEETATQAAAMNIFDPDSSWHKYAEPAEH
ncbi:MAG: DUF2950 domain-containing protein [Desulfuromonadales bacterium]|nr:DUF2950 domain-containing protein [Desulfuromonadales bacterium]